MDQSTAFRGLRNARDLNRNAARAKQRADEAIDEAVVDAFGAGISIGTIAAELEVSVSKVRAIRDQHGIAPDPRYAHLRPPARTEEVPPQ